jgi:adenylyltransferase/sulfurtransferase
MTKLNTSPMADITVELSESRYDRQERVSWWDQSRLARATVLVVGAGALGNEVVKNLALVGVGNVVVVDLDVIETSNLARCIFFRAEDEGRPKALVLAERAATVDPDIAVHGIVADIRSFGTGVALRADVIIGALDNREARLYCNRLAARVGRSWVDGAIEALSGVARVFAPPDTCYECTLTDADWENLAHRQSCRLLSRDDLIAGKVPTTASTSSIIAGVEVQEAVKLLHRDRDGVRPLQGAIVFDGANNDAYPLAYPVNPDCLAHHHFEDPVVLSSSEEGTVTAAWLAQLVWPDGSEDQIVVDLGDDHVIGWSCPGCGSSEPVGRPASLISWGESVCPQCGEYRLPDSITSVPVSGPLAETPLADLGVRADEILSLRSGLVERFVWIRQADARLPKGWSSRTEFVAEGAL